MIQFAPLADSGATCVQYSTVHAQPGSHMLNTVSEALDIHNYTYSTHLMWIVIISNCCLLQRPVTLNGNKSVSVI